VAAHNDHLLVLLLCLTTNSMNPVKVLAIANVRC